MAIIRFKGSHAIGRRKTAIARVFLSEGTGEYLVNGMAYEAYFGRESLQRIARQPLDLLEVNKKFNVSATVKGGGKSGQADALKLGISRALILHDTEVRPALKKEGYLTRDQRAVERKKYGRHKARRRPQFSKR